MFSYICYEVEIGMYQETEERRPVRVGEHFLCVEVNIGKEGNQEKRGRNDIGMYQETEERRGVRVGEHAACY